MLARMLLAVLCALIPSLAFAQGETAAPKPNIDTYSVDAQGCIRDLLRVISQMQPGSLATLARTVARDRCLKEQDENLRNACIKDVDQK